MDGFSWFSSIRAATDIVWMYTQFMHFWTSAGHGPISDFFSHIGPTSIHFFNHAGHTMGWVVCKGRHIEFPVTQNGVETVKNLCK